MLDVPLLRMRYQTMNRRGNPGLHTVQYLLAEGHDFEFFIIYVY